MRITHYQKGDKLTIYLDGEIDHHNAAKIRTYIDELIENEKVNILIFDFYRVTFMDSSGIGIVLGRYKLIKESGGKVQIINISPKLKKIFEMSGINRLVDIE
jgi:stage II sporulation protein AA (anti-sigma F factor antagonist)